MMKSKYNLLLIFVLLLSACAPAFDKTKYGTAERDVTYCTMKELPQKMDVYYPSSGGPFSVLMYVHGGS